MRILITGGAGFIGSAVIRQAIADGHTVHNIDALTYAANLNNLTAVSHNDNYAFTHADICDRPAMDAIFKTFQPDAVLHLAAESHVDRSIDGPADFIRSNVTGTFTLLESARDYWMFLPPKKQLSFRFLHISTDEVYGDLEPDDPAFTEASPYLPSSPYAASKAAADHLVRAWGRTYGLPIIVTNCSNNYGPFQFPEKLIPTIILKGLRREALPIYGTGMNVRDWLYVEDHARALLLVMDKGAAGETYNIGGNNEQTNLVIAEILCGLLDDHCDDGFSHKSLIEFVPDRPGHDRRYAVNSEKIMRELGWMPSGDWTVKLEETFRWYLNNRDWWAPLLDRSALHRRGKPK